MGAWSYFSVQGFVRAANLSVLVPVMQIGVMRVRVAQGGMTMPVRMWLRHRAVMRVLMMIVMPMAMVVV